MAFASISLLISAAMWTADAPLHLSPYGLAKPVIVATRELPNDLEKPTDSTIIHPNDIPPDGFQFLKESDDSPENGLVGLYVPEDAIFQIRKRSMRNLGKGVVTLRLARSRTRPPRELRLEPGKLADYNEWRRCAIQRCQKESWPPKKPGTPNVPIGTLVIVGGGGMTNDIARTFIDSGGSDKGEFVMLPISMPDPINIAQEEQTLRRMGAKKVTVIPYREQSQLETPEVIDTLKRATGIWFGGGRQWNFVDAYEGTKLPGLFREVLSRGGVIGGSSAGATILGDYMVRGAPAGPGQMMCEGYEQALGFLPGVAIDQHFSARNRFKDMTGLMKVYPQFLGIGLDESTAIVVRGNTAEILGRGNVHFYDTRRKRASGEPDFDAYPAGTKYDLVSRKVIAPPI